MVYDAVVIGAGLGGLTAGAKLAKEGRKVLVVEQHAVPGGCATTFRRKDFTIEVGLHELDGLHEDDPKVAIFRDLGVFDNVEFVRVPEFYRCVGPGVDIVIPDDHRKAVDVLVQRFPHEEKGIRRFFKVIMGFRREIYRLPRGRWRSLLLSPLFPILYPNIAFRENQTLAELLQATIRDEDLRMVLLANLGYYHDDPYTMSLLYYAAGQGSYFSGGGHFIKGGSQKLSDHLAGVIRSNGGEVVLKHLVTSIITEDNRAVGIRYRKKADSDEQAQEARGRFVVANAAIPNVVHDLLPPCAGRDKLAAAIENLEIGPSLISLYMGFKRPPKEMGNSAYSTMIAGEGVSGMADYAGALRGDLSRRGFIFVDYSQIDSGLAPEGKAVGVICTMDYLADWEKLGEEEYKAKKEQVARMFIGRLDRHLPGIKDEIEYYEVGTPKTIKRYTLNPGGTAYGFAEIPRQAGRKRIPRESPVENLYFASAWTAPGHGFSAAIASGYLCALKILKGP